ncbi:hypothetical protein [Curtanaerobium respiraculi]|uniref:hypothetical protein n=1 Tax=Curtanaerobium respiraculi TaxID=2949669 RepID=UPI0024B39B93|nr:hypothetical protein [Curtanaerobium respiraculi]
MDNSVPPTPRALCITGGPASGKTRRLAQHVYDLLRCGAAPGSVAAVTASPSGIPRLREALESIGIPTVCTRVPQPHPCTDGAAVRVRSVRELALEVLDEPGARAFTNRRPRVLEDFEETFLFEDMRASRIRQKRLRNLLRFMQRGFSELADFSPNWTVTDEEDRVLALLRSNLDFTDGILACEIGNLALRYLLSGKSILASHRIDHMVFDDYCLANRALQVLANTLAKESIVVAADPESTLEVHEPFPYEAGIVEFLKANPHADRIELASCHRSARLAAVIENLHAWENATPGRESGTTARKGPRAESFMEETVEGELNLIAGLAERELEEDPRARIFIAGVNPVWRRNLQRYLERIGFDVQAAPSPNGLRIRNDFRNEKRMAKARERTIDRLAQDPEDSVAWRAWCGFGDYLARSVQIAALCQLAGDRTLAHALSDLSAGVLPDACSADPQLATLAELYRTGSAAARARRVRQAAASPAGDGIEEGSDRHQGASIVIGPPESACNAQASLVIFGGFVNGWIPSRSYLEQGGLVGQERVRARQRDARACSLVASRATKRLVFTGFTSCSLEMAETLQLKIDRIVLRRGHRIALLSPSTLLT